ncbi:glycosyltransferase [Parvularcula dongshanensis]|uniref:Glycosyltransferase involved in cell wall biosynthesis n=1 Tax=Parvularcula dongshanensis TaxID=1173995 RepID=A0A840I5C3_9PROT|nr:glycosyltransferase [Parvularcula dongshanensis]MBB4659481.1 glycosyltransferase involved in cell wall biosynthesis [Parvularcula dongshanensis]
MKTLLFEPFQGGHYTNYVEALVDYHRRVHEARGDELVLSLTSEGAASSAFAAQVAPRLGAASVDPSIPPVPHSIALRPTPDGIRTYRRALTTLWRALGAAIERHQPDHLILPSADHITLAARFVAGERSRARIAGLKSTGVLHYGFAAGAHGVAELVKDQIYRQSWRRAPWSRLFMVNPMQVGWARTHMPGLSVEVCPDPVPLMAMPERDEACAVLGLDASKSYIGFVGAVRERAAFRELVHGFLDADLGPDWRLLVAGRVEWPEHKNFLKSDPRVAAARDRIVLIDRFLDADEMAAALSACSVLAPIYRQSQNLSANLLKAVRADKPVIASASGFGGYMVDEFGIGVGLPLDAPEGAPAAFRAARDLSGRYVPGVRTQSLKRFLEPDNFAATLFDDRNETLVPWAEVSMLGGRDEEAPLAR